jgi:hypothetical protein
VGVIIQDITPSFFAFWERAKECAPERQQQLWYELYEEPHRALFAVCGDRHGTRDALPAALLRFSADLPRLRETVPQLLIALERTGPELTRLFALECLDLRWVILVGMYWSDGWMVVRDGQPTCYIAVEMLESPMRAEILLLHEAAHVAHQICLGAEWENLLTLGDSLFAEGLATLVSAQIGPGLGEAAYLWAGKDQTHLRMQPMSEWLAQCNAIWPALRLRLVHEIQATDAETINPYFLGDHAPADLPERVGYFAGYRLVSALAKTHPIAEMARWPSARIVQVLERELRI